MSKVNGVNPGDFPGRPGHVPSRDLGQPAPKRKGCPPRAAALLLVVGGVAWGVVETVLVAMRSWS